MTRSTAKRLVLSGWLPLFSLLSYWLGVRGDYSINQLLLASAIALLVATGLFLYAPIARKVECGSIVKGLLWIAVIALGAIGFVSDPEPWGFPLFLFAIWALVFHHLCRQEEGKRDKNDACPHYQYVHHELCSPEDGKVKPSFCKAP